MKPLPTLPKPESLDEKLPKSKWVIPLQKGFLVTGERDGHGGINFNIRQPEDSINFAVMSVQGTTYQALDTGLKLYRDLVPEEHQEILINEALKHITPKEKETV
jgi:hypothetical protein